MESEGKIQVYTGDGKGKTTASIGLCTRALGAGFHVFYAQFMKDGTSSEIAFLKKSAPEHFVYFCRGSGKFILGTPSRDEVERAAVTLEALKEALESRKYDMVFADEIFGALNAGLLAREDVLSLMRARSGGTELILTGRNVPREIACLADLISEIECRRHYYAQGRPALKGIEF